LLAGVVFTTGGRGGQPGRIIATPEREVGKHGLAHSVGTAPGSVSMVRMCDASASPETARKAAQSRMQPVEKPSHGISSCVHTTKSAKMMRR